MRDFYNIPGLLGHIRDTQVTETGIGPRPLRGLHFGLNSLNQYFKNVDFFSIENIMYILEYVQLDMIDTD